MNELNSINVDLEIERQKLDILIKERQLEMNELVKKQLDNEFTEKASKKNELVKTLASKRIELSTRLNLEKEIEVIESKIEIMDIELISTVNHAVKSGISISRHKMNKLNQEMNNVIQ